VCQCLVLTIPREADFLLEDDHPSVLSELLRRQESRAKQLAKVDCVVKDDTCEKWKAMHMNIAASRLALRSPENMLAMHARLPFNIRLCDRLLQQVFFVTSILFVFGGA
jgi:hypothetical protein